MDPEIMGQFKYNDKLTKAVVHFQAHKFPYTASVYYQCSVHLCIHKNDGCKHVVSILFMDKTEILALT